MGQFHFPKTAFDLDFCSATSCRAVYILIKFWTVIIIILAFIFEIKIGLIVKVAEIGMDIKNCR